MDNRDIKIGIDFHGVISKRPQFFAEFTKCATEKGCQIHIITGGPKNVVEKYLQEHRVFYDKIFAILDYYDALGDVEYFSDGTFKIEDKLWDTAKAEYCALNGISLHIDDSRKYIQWFQTPFCHYDDANRLCITENNKTIDLSGSASSALDEILKIIKTTQYF